MRQSGDRLDPRLSYRVSISRPIPLLPAGSVKLENPPERVRFTIPAALGNSETRRQPAKANFQEITSRFLPFHLHW